MKKSSNRFGLKIALLLGSLVLAVLVCEVALRACGYYYAPFAIRMGDEVTDWRFKHLFKDTFFVHDPELIWRPQPGRGVFNSQGFRGRELPATKQADEFRIFTVGDSNTIGWPPHGLDDFHGANWPHSLDELLRTRGPKKISVTNASAWGYSTFQGVEMVRRILPYQPDLVLVSFGSNAAQRVAVSDADFNSAAFRSPIFNTRVGQLLKATWDKCRGATKSIDDRDLVFRVSLLEYRENLETIIRLCKEQGVQCVLLTRPYTGEVGNPQSWKHFAPDYRNTTLEVAKENEVPLIDIYDIFKDEEEYFADECHFTEDGHNLAAKRILKKIEPMLP